MEIDVGRLPDGGVVAVAAAGGARLGARIVVAAGFLSKLKGLMFVRALPSGAGLLLTGTSAIHMCFMRFPIDAVFILDDGEVVRVARGLKPWSGVASARARHVLELPSGAAESVCEGDRLEILS